MRKLFRKTFTELNVVIMLFIVGLLFMGAAREVYDVGILKVRTIQALLPRTTVTVQNPVVLQAWETVGTATTATLTGSTGDYVLVNKTAGLASLTVTLPRVTSALDGKVFMFKQYDSGTTPCVITPLAPYDTLEGTQGTLSGVTDYVIDALGDQKGWKARYVGAGVSNYWMLIHDDVT